VSDTPTDAEDESECTNCGASDDPEHGIIVGIADDIGTSICTVCLSEYFYGRTVLSERESEVAAHITITGAPPATIADRLGIARSTVNEYARRLDEKIEQSRETVALLG